MESTEFLVKSLVILGVFGITLLIATYSTYAERKVAAFIQDRIGPNRAGPLGLFQPLADAVKLFFKEEFVPTNANRFLFVMGPSLAMLTACMASAVIPFGNSFLIDGQYIAVQAIEVNIGILYIFGVVALGVYGIMIGGWASNNKFSLLGAIRAASQNISYELAMGMSIIALLLVTSTLSLGVMAQQQGAPLFGISGMSWNVFYQPLGFLIFLICAFAETNRVPFDLPECETELIGGYHTEYSSMGMGLYLFAEYVNIFVASAVMATLYFGGYNFPFMYDMGLPHNVVTVIGIVVFFTKILMFIFFFMWVRWTLPRFRYDQLMNLGWKILIPLSIANVILTATVILVKQYFFQ